MTRKPPVAAAALLALAAALGAAGSREGPTKAEAEEIEIALLKTQRRLRLSPVQLSSDRIIAGEKVFVRCVLANPSVEDLVLSPVLAKQQWGLGTTRVYLEKIGGAPTVTSLETFGRQGRRYLLSSIEVTAEVLRATAEGDTFRQVRPGPERPVVLGHQEFIRVHQNGIDTKGFPAGEYEITVDFMDKGAVNMLQTSKARFTVLYR